MHRGKRWSLHWSSAHLYAKQVELRAQCAAQGRGERAKEGMQRSANLPYACWSQHCQPLFCKSPLFVEGERVPFSAKQEKGGQLFSGGALISIVLRQKKLLPSFSY